MKLVSLFGLAALLPAALNNAPAPARGLAMILCGGDGVVRSITLPIGRSGIPPSESPACCAKGCRPGSGRKRAKRRFDPAQ